MENRGAAIQVQNMRKVILFMDKKNMLFFTLY